MFIIFCEIKCIQTNATRPDVTMQNDGIYCNILFSRKLIKKQKILIN